MNLVQSPSRRRPALRGPAGQPFADRPVADPHVAGPPPTGPPLAGLAEAVVDLSAVRANVRTFRRLPSTFCRTPDGRIASWPGDPGEERALGIAQVKDDPTQVATVVAEPRLGGGCFSSRSSPASSPTSWASASPSSASGPSRT